MKGKIFMKYVLARARRFGIPLMIALVMLLLGSQSSWAKSMSDAQSVQSNTSVVFNMNRVNESKAEVTNTTPLTSNVGGPPMGAAVAPLTATQSATVVVDAPWVTVSPFIENWGHRVRVTNYTGITQTVILAIQTAEEFGQPGLDYLEVNIGDLGECEYNAGHNEGHCIFDIAPNYYWDIYIEYNLNSVANPPHWEIFHCLRHMCDKTNVYFPPYFTSSIYLPVIIR